MFSGIVESTTKLLSIQGPRWTLAHDYSDLQLGESLAIDGVCLTVRSFSRAEFCVDLIEPTFQATYFRKVRTGHQFNLERALKVGDRIGGHWVSGHVDGVGRVVTVSTSLESRDIELESDLSWKNLIFPKGSIAINGVSLTVQEVKETSFSITLIPHTMALTTLGALEREQEVNLEFDWMAKQLDHLYRLRNLNESLL